ncbi:GNAT family N-acetyltransferase [Cohnella pontilimi]|nr:GNAT family N-acetyltransferase [Cohnella pontilimi]
MIFVKSSLELAAVELEIVNSDPFFNQVSKGKEKLELHEVEEDLRSDAEIGAERYLIQETDGRYVGTLGFLMRNPADGCTWLGLLQIRKSEQGKGYASRALEWVYEIMRERKVKSFRIGVIADNTPAHAFWKKQGFQPLQGGSSFEGRPVVIYEKVME